MSICTTVTEVGSLLFKQLPQKILAPCLIDCRSVAVVARNFRKTFIQKPLSHTLYSWTSACAWRSAEVYACAAARFRALRQIKILDHHRPKGIRVVYLMEQNMPENWKKPTQRKILCQRNPTKVLYWQLDNIWSITRNMVIRLHNLIIHANVTCWVVIELNIIVREPENMWGRYPSSMAQEGLPS